MYLFQYLRSCQKNFIEQERNIVISLSLENMHEFLNFIKKN